MTKIDSSIHDALETFTLPDPLGFGKAIVPAMYLVEYQQGEWQEAELLPYQPLNLAPAAKVLHYGQCIFEGLKAYKGKHPAPVMFRPLQNWERMNRSATRLCMPTIPKQLFMDGLSYVTAFSQDFIPELSGESLYLRPFMICNTADLGLGHSSSFSYMVIASPSQAYHAGAMKVLIQSEQCRAAMGGTGNVKVGGNYASALLASKEAESQGYHQCLWLDPEKRQYIEELSGMNVFALIDGVLHTPALTDSMLAGITRDSIIQLAKSEGIEVQEKHLAIQELLDNIRSGSCTEFFSCGTAAIISPISMLGDKDSNHYKLPEAYPVADKLREKLLAIQEGNTEDKFEWTYAIPPSYYPNSQKQDAELASV